MGANSSHHAPLPPAPSSSKSHMGRQTFDGWKMGWGNKGGSMTSTVSTSADPSKRAHGMAKRKRKEYQREGKYTAVRRVVDGE